MFQRYYLLLLKIKFIHFCRFLILDWWNNVFNRFWFMIISTFNDVRARWWLVLVSIDPLMFSAYRAVNSCFVSICSLIINIVIILVSEILTFSFSLTDLKLHSVISRLLIFDSCFEYLLCISLYKSFMQSSWNFYQRKIDFSIIIGFSINANIYRK